MEKIKINLLDFKDENREVLLHDFRVDWINLFLKMDLDSHVFIIIFIEMVKNIYDHADCNGVLMFNFKEKEFLFTISSSSKSNNFDYSKAKSLPSSKAGSGKNFGLGLLLIEELSSQLNLKLRIIQKKDRLTYVGRWKI